MVTNPTLIGPIVKVTVVDGGTVIGEGTVVSILGSMVVIVFNNGKQLEIDMTQVELIKKD